MNGGFKSLSELVSLRGKRSLVTGSASGIGKAIALRFAEAGSALELVDIDLENLKKVKEEASKFNVEVNLHKVDLSKKKEIDALWSALEGREPDILVNNAGIFPFKDFLEVDEAFLEKIFSVNLKAVFWMCQHMIKRRLSKGGVIINVGSIEAVLPFENEMAHYNVTKAGVIALSRSLAKDYGVKGFRVNVILPGGIMTPGTEKTAKDLIEKGKDPLEKAQKFMARLPLGKFGDPDEVARIALVLASDLASYVEGALIPVDGGFLSA
ncbi:MAG: SDR family NAD(P)-dependent oxidoreductase [Candidatus Jordarchaeales archaeon]|nr:SDR family oxidoreductase [Candidatus Jordarchaeia archaeon]